MQSQRKSLNKHINHFIKSKLTTAIDCSNWATLMRYLAAELFTKKQRFHIQFYFYICEFIVGFLHLTSIKSYIYIRNSDFVEGQNNCSDISYQFPFLILKISNNFDWKWRKCIELMILFPIVNMLKTEPFTIHKISNWKANIQRKNETIY